MELSFDGSEKDLNEKGFLVVRKALGRDLVSDLTGCLSTLKLSKAVSRKNNDVYGVRDLLNLSPKIREFSTSKNVRQIVENYLGKEARVVRAIYFNKTPDANWKVPWHQDLTIAVKERLNISGFSPWTRKADVWHVQPPIEILEKMLTLRFHLDGTDESNGALKVVPKSHLSGRLSAEKIISLRKANKTTVCSVKKGDCLIMRPLLLHSSSKGSAPKQRRVIHFEFASSGLPGGLEWHES